MATIEKRKTPEGKTNFRVKVRLKGFPTQTATFERITDARKWAEDTQSAIRENRHFKTTEAKKHTVGDMIEKFLSRGFAAQLKTADDRKQQLEWFKREIGSYSVAELTPSLISECKEKLEKQVIGTAVVDGKKIDRVRSGASVNRYLAALSRVLTIAVNELGWLEQNPMRKVSRCKESRGRDRYLFDDERTRFLDACKQSDSKFLYLIVVLALSTGMRHGEIVNLTWDDVDLSRGIILLKHTKNGESRGVPIKGHALTLFREHAKLRRLNTNLVFPGNKPEQPIKIRQAFLFALNKAEIKNFRFHDLRHSAASYLAMGGASLTEIAAILGHKTLAMVRRYSHLSDSHVAGVVEKMNTRIFG